MHWLLQVRSILELDSSFVQRNIHDRYVNMIKIQQQSFGNVLGSIYVSDPFKLDITTATVVAVSGCVLKLNGFEIQSTSVTVHPGDDIVLKITNSRLYNTTTYGILTTVDNDTYIVSSTTTSTKVHSINSKGLSPFEFITDPTGCTHSDVTSDNNKISILFQSGDIISIPSSYDGLNVTEYVPPIPTISVSTNISLVYPGDSYTVTWISTSVTSDFYVTINSDTTQKAASGSETISTNPSAAVGSIITTTVNLYDSTGKLWATETTPIRIIVRPVISITIAPTIVYAGDGYSVSWSVSNYPLNSYLLINDDTTHRNISGTDNYTVPVDATVGTVIPFLATLYNASGSVVATKSSSISVSKTPTITVTAPAYDVYPGDSYPISWTNTDAPVGSYVVINSESTQRAASGSQTYASSVGDAVGTVVTYAASLYKATGALIATNTTSVTLIIKPTMTVTAPSKIYPGDQYTISWTTTDSPVGGYVTIGSDTTQLLPSGSQVYTYDQNTPVGASITYIIKLYNVTGRLISTISKSIILADITIPNMILALNGDGVSGTSNITNAIIDSSANNFTVSRTGSTTQGSVTPFGTGVYSKAIHGGSVQLYSGGYLTVPTHNNLLIGSQDYTVEFWMYIIGSANASQNLFSQRPATGGSTAISLTTTSSKVKLVTPVVITGTTTLASNKWYHVAVSRSGGVTRLFLDGKLEGSIADTVNYTQGVNNIGRDEANPNQLITANISNFRFVIGTGLYTSDFTPATAPLTTVPGTQLLLSGTNGAVVDRSRKTMIYGGAIQTTATSSWMVKYGTGSIGTGGSQVSIPPLAPYSLMCTDYIITGENFTIEGWYLVYGQYISDSNYRTLFRCGNLSIVVYDRGFIDFHLVQNYNDGGSSNFIGTKLISSTNINSVSGVLAWYHVALVRYNGVISLYINGISRGTTAGTNASFSGQFEVGGTCFDELYVIKGIAKYTTNFTPPTQALVL